MTEHHIYYVDAAHEGARLDAFLTAHLRAHSRSRIKAFIDAGHVTVDGTVAKPALHLRRGQRAEVVVPPQPSSTVTPAEIPFPVVFEDEHLLVINKPPDLTVHPGAGRASGTLLNAILPPAPCVGGNRCTQHPREPLPLDSSTAGQLSLYATSSW